MDMYRILENFDAVNSKQTLVEGQMKRHSNVARAESMSKADFVADAGEYGMSTKEAAEFWIVVNGGDEEEDLDEERRSPEEFDADALAKQKARLAREKQKIMMQRKISGQDSGKPPVVRDMSEDDMEEGNLFTGNLAKARAAGKKQADLDGDGDMEQVQEVFPGTPEYELRFGKDDVASAFDKKKVSTGTVYSRKHFDEPDTDDDTPKSAGRPKGTGRKLGAKGPSVASKLLKGKGGLKEHDDVSMMDQGEYNDEAGMARQDLHTMVDAAKELHAILASDENLPEWVQSKITKALDYLDTARDYVKSSHAERGEEINEFAPIVAALGRAAVAGAASGAVQSAMGEDEVAEASPAPAPHGFKKGDEVILDGGSGERGTIVGVGNEQSPGGTNTVYIQWPGSNGAPAYNSQNVKLAPALPSFKRGDKVTLTWKGKTYPGYTYIRPSTDKYEFYSYATSPGGADELWPTDSYTPAGVSEAGYSAKAARAGKDIGKPGKNFAKIAKGAAERYGSKERGEKIAGAVLAKLRAKEGVESVEEKAPPGAKAERMVKHIKSGYAKDGKLTDKEKSIAYATAWKAKKAGKVEEESSDKKDVPFDGPYRTKGDDKDQFGNTVKHTARHAAKKGLADMTTAELKAELKRRSQVEEESTDTQDQHAEKAGKKVTKDLEYDMKHRGKDDAKAEKAGKKVTKDIEYDDKKDKKKEVDETTVSGSVAPAAGGAAPKSKNGMQFGKGVYEGQVAESFEKQLKNVLNEGMSVNVSTDDTGKKSISVNATDEDADALGDMLKMAGLFSSEGYSRACTNCGGIHEAGACGADMVEEELANSPDEVYADADYMTQTLSGGLNGPKTTGQTTGPVVNRQNSRQGVMAEAERVKEAAESRLWNLYRKI